MNGQSTEATLVRGELTGRKVFAWFFGFFALVIGVNAVMIYLAVSTFSGLETEDAYRKGRDYNRTLEAAQRQQQLGWQAEMALVVQQSNTTVLTVQFRDAQGLPLQGLVLIAELRRPATDRMDQVVVLEESTAGLYRGRVALPALGNWVVRVEARNDSGDVFQVSERMFVGS